METIDEHITKAIRYMDLIELVDEEIDRLTTIHGSLSNVVYHFAVKNLGIQDELDAIDEYFEKEL